MPFVCELSYAFSSVLLLIKIISDSVFKALYGELFLSEHI